MTDQVRDAGEMTPGDARRAVLLKQLDSRPAETPTHRTNPYAFALGWVGAILLGVGVIIMLVAASQASDQPDGIVNLPTLLTGSAFTAFGLLGIMLLLAAQLVRWTPPA